MVMLDDVVTWDNRHIVCRSRRHLDLANPLRHRDRLPALAGAELCLQAAALHGGLIAGAAQAPGYVASLRALVLTVDRLDDPAFESLIVEAVREAQEPFGMSYSLHLRTESGATLLTARATIKLPV